MDIVDIVVVLSLGCGIGGHVHPEREVLGREPAQSKHRLYTYSVGFVETVRVLAKGHFHRISVVVVNDADDCCIDNVSAREYLGL